MAAIAAMPYTQIDRTAGNDRENWRGFINISHNILARPADEAILTTLAVRLLHANILDFLSQHKEGGEIHWKQYPAIQVMETKIVRDFREDGPEIDYLTKKRCVTDNDWLCIHASAQLKVQPKSEGKRIH